MKRTSRSNLIGFALLVGIHSSLVLISPVRAVPITVSGTIRYTAPTGNLADDTANALSLFPLRGAKVELWDDNTLILNLPPDIQLGTTYTNDAGFYSFTVDDLDTLFPLGGTIDPFLRIFGETRPALPAAGGIKSAIRMYAAGPLDMDNDTVGPAYGGNTVPAANIPAGMNYTINVDIGTANNTELSFAPFDAMVEASRYYSTLPGSFNNSVDTLFPTGESTSNFSNGRMHILQGDRYDWDVDLHEYGHYVQSLHPGISRPDALGGHNPNFNLRFQRMDLTREQANGLAWSEGWATYYSISGQQEMNSAAHGIQRVGDTIYNDNSDATGTTIPGGLRTSLENSSIGTSRGEDNETSVMRILYDLYDANNEAAHRDRVTLGDDAIWNIIRNSKSDTLDKFWDALISQPGTTNSDRIDYGAIFEAQNVSPQPDEISVPLGTAFPRFDVFQPTFEWDIPKGGSGVNFNNNLLNDFGVLFIDSADDILWDTGLLGNTTMFTPDPLDWLAFTANTDLYRWVVYGRMTNKIAGVDYITGDFWSDARYFFVVPEPTAATLMILAGCWLLGPRLRRGS